MERCDKMIPLSIPNFEGNEKLYVNKAIEQAWVSTAGEYVNLFEKNLTDYLGTTEVAVCQSGTAALHLALIDAGIEADDYVIVSPLTFIAAVNPIVYQKARPIFIDCDDSLCMDPLKLAKFCDEECVFENGILKYRQDMKNIKAIIVVHIFGNMADMEQIMDIAKIYNLKVVEDATEALGSRYTEGKYKGKYAGTIGDYGAYSFNGNKIITTGGGGAITAKKVESVRHMRYLSTQAKDNEKYYIHNEVGYNYRMTNLQAALGVAQLEEIEEFIKRKQKNYDIYKTQFEGFKLCKLLGFRDDIYSNKWFYSLKINKDYISKGLEDIIEELQKCGIQTRKIWGLIHEQIPYKHDISYNIENAVTYSESVINIPCSTNLSENEIFQVIRTIKNVLTKFEK